MVVGVPGRLERLDAKAAGLERPLHDLDPVALDQLLVAGDVVVMRVRRQQVRDRQPFALDDLVQRRERRAAVDEDGRSARLVGEQIGVREPVGMHASFDQHVWTVSVRKDRRAGGLLSQRAHPLVITGGFGGTGTSGTVTSAPPEAQQAAAAAARSAGLEAPGRQPRPAARATVGGGRATGTVGAWETGGKAGTRAGAGAAASIPRIAAVRQGRPAPRLPATLTSTARPCGRRLCRSADWSLRHCGVAARFDRRCVDRRWRRHGLRPARPLTSGRRTARLRRTCDGLRLAPARPAAAFGSATDTSDVTPTARRDDAGRDEYRRRAEQRSLREPGRRDRGASEERG